MKILLACTSIQDEHRDENVHDTHYPLGLAYLQSYLEHTRPDKDEFVNLYLNNVPYEECYSTIIKSLNDFKPDVFGVSIMTHSRVSAYKMIEYAHKNFPETKILVGGMHPTVMWEQFAKKYPYVTIVRGEGEKTFHNIIEALDKGDSLKEIPGVAYWEGEEVFTTGNAPLIDDLDDLPFPKHELFVDENKGMANLLTSRGCPYRCNFCVLDWMSKRQVRFRSGDDIADEVEMILEKFPSVRTIWIHDDAFMINKNRTIEFCEAIINRGIKTQFVASARFRPISEEVVYKMEEAGFVQVLFGLESGAEEVIKGMRKGISKEHVRYGLDLFAKTSMKATAFIIAGLPGETDETIDETIDFVQELQNINYLFYDDIGVAMVYPGTEMYEMVKATGKIDDDYWLTDGDVPYFTDTIGAVHTYEKLLGMKEKIRKAIALNFLFTPEGFLKQRKVIPPMLKYCQQHNMTGINKMLYQAVIDNDLLPPVMHSTYFGASPELRKNLSIVFENLALQLVTQNHFKTQEEADNFGNLVREQRTSDEKTLIEYEKRRKAIHAKLSKEDDEGDVEYVRKKYDTVAKNVPRDLGFHISTVGGVGSG